jgi:hypothetical protein
MSKRLPAPTNTIALVWAAILGQAVAATAFAGEIDKHCLADLMENGPPAWKKVASFVENIAVAGHEHRVDRTDEKGKPVATTSDTDWSLCWNRPSGLRFLERRYSDVGRRNLYVVNPQYRFNLSGRKDGDQFQLDSGQRFAPKRLPTYDLTEEQFRDLLEAGIKVYGIRLGDLLTDKEFRLDHVAYVPDGSATDKRVLIEWRYLGSEGGRTRRAGGIYLAVLNPQNCWQVDRTEVRIPGSTNWGGWKSEVTYQEADTPVPFPATVAISFSRPAAKLAVDDVHTFDKPTTCERSENEFFLPYYGIPESALGLPATPWWRPWLLYGGSLLGLGLVVYFASSWFRRKRLEA